MPRTRPDRIGFNRLGHQICRASRLLGLAGSLTLFQPNLSAANPLPRNVEMQIHLGYMSEAQTSERISVGDLTSYIDALRTLFGSTVSAHREKSAVDVVVMVKPSGRTRVWLIPHTPSGVTKFDLPKLKSELEAIPGPRVRISPLCFALMFSINGGTAEGAKAKMTPQPPIPEEWKEAFAKASPGKQLLDYFSAIWPDDEQDQAALRMRKIVVPEGFELQVLEPLGGKIARPKGWFFDQGSNPSGYVWTISKDQNEQGGFVVGMRIQLLAKVKEGTGLSPEKFVDRVITQMRPTTKVLSECPESETGFFRRRCIETEGEVDCAGHKERLRDLYSFFWSDAADLVVISIFGAPPNQWDSLQQIRETMSEFELIDMSRSVSTSNSAATAQ